MSIAKNVMLGLFAVSVLVGPALAGLTEEVDKLTPKEAALFQEKLNHKVAENFPGNAGGTGFVQFINPTTFNSAFPGLNPIRNLYGGTFNFRVPVNDKFLLGGSFGGAGNYSCNESATKVYEDLTLFYGAAQFVVDYRIINNDSFILSTSAGLGLMLGGFNYAKTDDNLKSYYNTNRWGTGLCNSLSLDANWKVEKGWGFGMGVGYFSGKLGNMKKSFNGIDNTSPDIDLTGVTFRISGNKYF